MPHVTAIGASLAWNISMSTPSITRRHRILALTGAAVVAGPLLFGAIIKVGNADAASGAMAEQTALTTRSFADIVAADKPAVVTVTTKMKQQDASADQQQLVPGSPYDQFFHQFFGDKSPVPAPPRGQLAEALGSGFIIASDGTIVTNNHVVDGATEITVTLDNGKEYKARLVGRDAKTDLAVLKIEAGDNLPTVTWGDSDRLRAGDSVLAMGNPFGIGTTVTSGIVSARGRDLHNGPYDDFIQVDAAINHGNSGGPLFDADGKVVGINTAIYSPNGGSVGVGFAIPSDQAQAVVAKLIQSGSIEHGYLGVQIQPVTQDVADALGLASASGALVAEVVDGSPAANAGIASGDVVTSFAGKPVASARDLSRLVADVAPGTSDNVTVWRKGKEVKLGVTVGDNGDEQQVSATQQGSTQNKDARLMVPELGLGLTEITPDLRQNLGIDKSIRGAIVSSVDPDKPAAERGIHEGDIVTSVNEQRMKSAKDVVQAIHAAEKSGHKSVLLQVLRDGDQMFVGVPTGNT